jgi:hypothetical protein
MVPDSRRHHRMRLLKGRPRSAPPRRWDRARQTWSRPATAGTGPRGPGLLLVAGSAERRHRDRHRDHNHAYHRHGQLEPRARRHPTYSQRLAYGIRQRQEAQCRGAEHQQEQPELVGKSALAGQKDRYKPQQKQVVEAAQTSHAKAGDRQDDGQHSGERQQRTSGKRGDEVGAHREGGD